MAKLNRFVRIVSRDGDNARLRLSGGWGAWYLP